MSKSVSLFEASGEVSEPRGAQGRRHPLPAILALTTVAILSGARSLYVIAQFRRDRGQSFTAALGFTRDVSPCCATRHHLFVAVDRRAFEPSDGFVSEPCADRPPLRRCTTSLRFPRIKLTRGSCSA